jgi:hypothetical protein
MDYCTFVVVFHVVTGGCEGHSRMCHATNVLRKKTFPSCHFFDKFSKIVSQLSAREKSSIIRTQVANVPVVSTRKITALGVLFL